MNDCRSLPVGREHASIRHAANRHAKRPEPAYYLARRTLPNGPGNPFGAWPDVAQEIIGRNVLREIASAIRGHEHL
jgi:hypothetical protein